MVRYRTNRKKSWMLRHTLVFSCAQTWLCLAMCHCVVTFPLTCSRSHYIPGRGLRHCVSQSLPKTFVAGVCWAHVVPGNTKAFWPAAAHFQQGHATPVEGTCIQKGNSMTDSGMQRLLDTLSNAKVICRVRADPEPKPVAKSFHSALYLRNTPKVLCKYTLVQLFVYCLHWRCREPVWIVLKAPSINRSTYITTLAGTIHVMYRLLYVLYAYMKLIWSTLVKVQALNEAPCPFSDWWLRQQ